MSKRILIVDDDPEIRRIVTMTLSDDSPYEVSAVSSAEAALLHVSRQPVDLLFTDIQMPGMNGLDLVRRVHELDPNTAVIIFTISPENLTPDRVAELNVDFLLAKPVEPDRLRMTVDTLLNPIKQMPRPSQRASRLAEVAAAPSSVPEVSPPPSVVSPVVTGPLGQRVSALRAKRQTGALNDPQVAMRLTPSRSGRDGRSYSEAQIEQMRLALKDLAMEPDVYCAVLADISGMVLTHWSRQRDINVTVVAALAVGNTLAMAEISRNLGQRQPGHLVIHEGQDQSIIMATADDLLLLIAIGPNASLGWARITMLRACEDVLRIAHGG